MRRLTSALLIIIFGLALITSIGNTLDIGQQIPSSYDRTYTFDVERGNSQSTYTLYMVVPPSLYDYYNSKSHSVNGERDYAKFVTPGAFITVAENIRKIASTSSSSDEDFANDVLALVHQIPYKVSASKYSVEAIVDNSGDCDVLSFLAASIMKAGDLDVVLFVYRGLPGSHMNIGVHLPYTPLNAPSDKADSFEYNNKTYWVAECTPGKWNVGQQPKTFANVKPTIISLENLEEPSPALISSSLNSPLTPSSISITLSSENSNASEKERQLKISGSISPAYSGEKVVLYVSQDRSSGEVFQTETDQLGNYSLTWNVTSTGVYYVRTSLIPFSNYAGSDSDLMAIFAGSIPQWFGGNNPDYYGSSDNTGYQTLSSKNVKDFLKRTLEGKNVSLSGEFMILKSGQTATVSERTITIPERVQTVILRRGHRITLVLPEQTVTVQGSEPTNNQFGFILQNDNGNFSANVRLLSDSDVSQMEKQFSENNSTFMNASTSVKENIWHNVVVEVSKGEITAKLSGENGTLLKNLETKDATGNSECGILISCTPDTLIAFKNLKVENLDQQPNEPTSDIQVPEKGLELLAPYVMLTTLIATAGATITYWRKRKNAKDAKS